MLLSLGAKYFEAVDCIGEGALFFLCLLAVPVKRKFIQAKIDGCLSGGDFLRKLSIVNFQDSFFVQPFPLVPDTHDDLSAYVLLRRLNESMRKTIRARQDEYLSIKTMARVVPSNVEDCR
jgi:hypothetical protein